MNAREGFLFSNQEKSFGNGNGFMPKHFKNNSNQLSVSQSGKNNNICGKSEAQMRTESVSKKIRLSPEFILQEGDLGSTSKEPSPLGLKLPRTPSFLSKLGKMSQEKKPRQELEGSSHAKRKAKTEEEKFKAGNFPAVFIKIGAWQRMARHEGDLVVKLYYAKRKLVWEVLEGPLKSKMEIQWSDICAIRAITPENEPGILEIELIQPPVYYRETCPQPRKHTLWRQSSDFTGGQAPIWRRHQVTFPPGILDKNYEKMLQCDVELNAISKKPFPKHKSPYFDPYLFETTLNFSGYGANKAAHYPYRAYPTIIPREPLFRATPNPSLSVLDLPLTYQGGGNYNFVAQNQASWQQSLSIPRDNFGISSTTTNVYDPPFPSTTNDNNVYDPLYYDPNASGLLTGIQTDLLDNAQLDDALLETVGSINISSPLEPMGFNNNINESSYRPDMAFHAISGDQGNNYNMNGMIPDPIHWLAAQGSSENVFQGLSENMFHNSGEDVFQGSGKDVFQGLGEDVFQGSCEDAFQGSSEYVFQGVSDSMFQGASDNMFQGASDMMFELAGNNPMNVGVGGFSNLFPF